MEREGGDKKEESMNNVSNSKSLEYLNDKAVERFFAGNPNLHFLFNKTKRIVTASFLISNFLPETDVLRTSIRQTALGLLHASFAIKDNGAGQNGTFEKSVVELGSLFDVAYFAGFVSQMNADVLRDELGKILSFYKNLQDSTSLAGPALEPEFFGDDWKGREEKDFLRENGARDRLDSRVSSLTESGEDRGSAAAADFSPASDLNQNGENGNGRDKKLKEFGPVAIKRNRRQSVIINYLKRKKTAMVKDFSAIITDCSEKTIQRELSALVDEGVLKKEGERRWTKYSLAA